MSHETSDCELVGDSLQHVVVIVVRSEPRSCNVFLLLEQNEAPDTFFEPTRAALNEH